MPRKRRKGRRPGRPGRKMGDGVSGRLLAQLNLYHSQLAARCEAIQSEMNAIAAAMSALGSAPRASRSSRLAAAPVSAVRRGAGRPGRPVRGPRGEGRSLKDFIRKVVSSSGSPLRVVEITQGVLKAGYATSSRNLANQVSMALADMTKKKLVRKVGRGTYTS